MFSLDSGTWSKVFVLRSLGHILRNERITQCNILLDRMPAGVTRGTVPYILRLIFKGPEPYTVHLYTHMLADTLPPHRGSEVSWLHVHQPQRGLGNTKLIQLVRCFLPPVLLQAWLFKVFTQKQLPQTGLSLDHM